LGVDAILNECARGEESARQAYERALAEDLAPAVRPMIERQLARIVQAHERIRGLDRAA